MNEIIDTENLILLVSNDHKIKSYKYTDKGLILDMEELEPCPFCGKKAVLLRDNGENDGYSCTWTTSYGCGCQTKDCRGEIDNDTCNSSSSCAAIYQWNKRKKAIEREG